MRGTKNPHSTRGRATTGKSKIAIRKRRRRRIRRIKRLAASVVITGCLCIGVVTVARRNTIDEKQVTVESKTDRMVEGTAANLQKTVIDNETENEEETEEMLEVHLSLEEYPEELQEMLEKYPETYDFVTGYFERSKYQGKEIDLTEEVEEGEVPLLLQWDKRWGYDSYGSKMIGSSGCGPTCMSMAYIYLTGDTEMNPREMAEFADRNGYNSEAGTKWDFMTEGAEQLGLTGREMGLSEDEMKEVLDSGKVIICSMKPGDFTKTGHFILIRGYDRKGFLVNDPNSKKNSEKHWEYETLYYQIKGAWSIGE